MRYLELLVTDIADNSEPTSHLEWVHRDHIETIEPYTTDDGDRPMLWLELTLTSGRIRYVPLQPTRHDLLDATARTAVATLLDSGEQPIAVAELPD